jgi:WD40 repeat protein
LTGRSDTPDGAENGDGTRSGDAHHRREALSVGVPTFARPPHLDPDDEARLPLTFARARVRALTEALTAFGYACTAITEADDGEPLHAARLGARVRATLRGPGPAEVRIVHVISHGEPLPTALYALGADGVHHPDTQVNAWLSDVEDFPGRPPTLFLLDLCHSGAAARLPWQTGAMDGTNRAWVVAGSQPHENAFEGRFTQAVADVLTALARKEIRVDRAHRYIDLGWLITRIHGRTLELAQESGGLEQHVSGTAVTGSYPELPFFPNPCHEEGPVPVARATAQALAAPFLDEVADPAHFTRHAAGAGPGRPAGPPEPPTPEPPTPEPPTTEPLFTGRDQEATALAAWLDGEEPPGPRIVTGSPGAGKSALLGVLVCAAHPQLRDATRPLWQRLRRPPARNPRLAAVHARQRALPEVIASIAAQLALPAPHRGWTPAALTGAVAALAEPPAIVVDALDEAADPGELAAGLLGPLSATRRPDGLAACRLAVGTRDDPRVRDLLHAAPPGALVDLDRVPPEVAAGDLRHYLLRRLAPHTPRRGGRAADAFATAVAGALTHRPPAPGGPGAGPFLLAAMYASHVVRGGLIPWRRPHRAAALGRAVPLDLARMLDLRFPGADGAPIRPVLTALAHAHADGMPAELIRVAAGVFAPGAGPAASDVAHALDESRFYLRTAPDERGTMVHRLFHQSVADHLRARARTEVPGAAAALFDALMATATGPGGRPRWQDADPYLHRHLARHAVEAGRLDTLCADPEFLVHAHPDGLVPELRHVRSGDAADHAAVYRTTAHLHRAVLPRQRRDILAVDAARHGLPLLTARLARPPGGEAMPWSPAWATGSRISAAHSLTLAGPTEGVLAVAGTLLGSRPVAVTGGADGSVRVWDVWRGREAGPALGGHGGEVRAVACATVAGTPVAVTGGADGAVRLWDLVERRRLGPDLAGHGGAVRVVAVTSVAGRPVAVTGDDEGVVRVWDLTTFRLRGPAARAHGDRVTALACCHADRPLAVSADAGGTLRVHDLLDGAASRPLGMLPDTTVHAVACADVAGTPTVLAAGEDGAVHAWDLAGGRPLPWTLTGREGPVYALDVVPGTDGPRLVTGGSHPAIRLWDLPSARTVERLTGHMGAVTTLACVPAPGGPVVLSASTDRTLTAWVLSRPVAGAGRLVGHQSWVNAVACTEVGGVAVAVSGGADGTLRCWDVARGRAMGGPLTGHRGPVHAVACAEVGGVPVAVSGGADGTLRWWDVARGRALGGPLTGHEGPVHAVACAEVAGVPVAVSGGADGSVRSWDLAAGRRRGAPLRTFGHGICAVGCVTADGRPLAVCGGDDGVLTCWDLTTGLGHGTPIRAHDGWVTALARVDAGPGPTVLSGGADGSVRAWDVRAGRPAGEPLPGVVGGVNAVACAVVHGRALAAAADDSGVRLWDLATGSPVDAIGVPGTVPAVALHSAHLVLGVEWEVVVLRGARPGDA